MKIAGKERKFNLLYIFVPLFLFCLFILYLYFIAANPTTLDIAFMFRNEKLAVKAAESIDKVNRGTELMNWRPIHTTAMGGFTRATEILLDRGAEIDPIEADRNMTPLDLALYYKHYDTARLLVERGADVESALDRVKSLGRDKDVRFLESIVNENVKKKSVLIQEDGEKKDEEKKE